MGKKAVSIAKSEVSEIKKPRYRFRGPYKKHPKPISPYKTLNEVSEKLACFFPVWLNHNKDFSLNFWGLRLWQRIYPHERIKGRFRIVTEAEIVGTENLYINERLKLHSNLLTLLENGKGLTEALAIVRCQMSQLPKEELKGFTKWLKQLRG